MGKQTSSRGRTPASWRAVVLPGALALLAVACLTWPLANSAGPEATPLGSVVAIVLGGALGICATFLLLGRSPPQVVAGSLPVAAQALSGDRPGRTTWNHARWLIYMRWLAVLLAGLLTVFAVRVLHVLAERLFLPLLLIVVALACTNIAYVILEFRGLLPRASLSCQQYTDLLALVTLLHFSGGIENPLCVIAIFHVIISGILLSRPACYAVAATAIGLLTLMTLGEKLHVLHHYTFTIFPHDHGSTRHAAHQSKFVISMLLLYAMLLSVTAVFITSLTGRLRAEERQTEHLAREALAGRRMLESVVEATGVALAVVNSRREVVWADSQLEQVLALPSESGRRSDRLGAWLAEISAPLHATINEGQWRVTERALLPENGQARYLQIITAPLEAPGDEELQAVVAVQDVTRQKNAQAEVLKAGRLAAVGELAGKIAHEVNNPIAIVSGKARLLLKDHREGMPEKVAADLHKIVDLADRVGRIAQGLLDLCRRRVSVRVPLDVQESVRGALALVDHLTRASGVHTAVEFASDLPLVEANPDELEQVFLNLLVNALDAMPDGGTLTVKTAHSDPEDGVDGPCVVVSISDTGAGIPDEVRPRIFDPLFTTKAEGHGTGLGLPISAGLVRAHRGQIHLRNRPEGGATFAVILPARPDGTTDGR